MSSTTPVREIPSLFKTTFSYVINNWETCTKNKDEETKNSCQRKCIMRCWKQLFRREEDYPYSCLNYNMQKVQNELIGQYEIFKKYESKGLKREVLTRNSHLLFFQLAHKLGISPASIATDVLPTCKQQDKALEKAWWYPSNEYPSYDGGNGILTSIMLNPNSKPLSSYYNSTLPTSLDYKSILPISFIHNPSKAHFPGACRIREWMLQSKNNDLLIGIKRLNLSYSKIETVPSELQLLSRLQSLNLSNNEITIIPNWLANMPSLEWFFACDNEITIIPSGFVNSPQLKVFEGSNNQIKDIPPFKDTKLIKLELAGNLITEIPQELIQNRDLELLNLNHNLITNLPKAFATSSIKTIYLYNNLVTTIPAEIKTAIQEKSIRVFYGKTPGPQPMPRGAIERVEHEKALNQQTDLRGI